jgi:hypothetical protein
MRLFTIPYTVLAAAARTVFAGFLYQLRDIADCFPFLPQLLSFAEDCIADVLLLELPAIPKRKKLLKKTTVFSPEMRPRVLRRKMPDKLLAD